MNKIKQDFKIGDKVTFDTDKVNDFISETSCGSSEIKEYQKLVLAGINQVGTVMEHGFHLTTVAYNDGWELPIPTKYLVLLSSE